MSLCRFNTVLLMVMVFLSVPVKAEKILDQNAVEKVFREKLISYQELISNNKIKELQEAVKEFTHEDTIILFEFALSLPGGKALPAQKAYFNRDPFIDLLKNASSLEPGSFKISYSLEEFSPQYGGKTAIIRDSGTAKGRLNESFSDNSYEFEVAQKCRNTISADAVTIFKVDSIYCRMDITYNPLNKSLLEGAGQEIALEKPAINDIISEIEEKKRKKSTP